MSASSSHLIAPHGGELIQLLASPEKAAELKAHSREWPSWDLTARQICDLELLMSGGFSPLRGFMTRADYEGVCHNMRLGSGILWPMPITLDVTPAFAGGYVVNGHTASRAETQFLASYGVQPGSWKVDGYGISPAVQKATAPVDTNAQSCRYVLDVKLCD